MALVESSTNHLNPSSHFRQRRTSLESVFSELSELTVLPHESSGPALARTMSNASNASKHSTYSRYTTAGKPSLRQRLSEFYDENYGALLVLLSQLFGALMNISTRLLEHEGSHGSPMHPFQILFVRQSLTALLCTVYAVLTKSIPYFPLGPPDRKVRMLLMCRGLAGFFGVFGLYFSLLYLPLSEATVLTFLAPILTCYLCSYLIPGEIFSRHQQMAGFLSLFGVVFIAQPFSLFSSSAASDKNAADGGSSSHANMTLTNTTSAISGAKAGFVEAQPTPSEHLLAIVIAMVGVVGATVAITSIRAIGTRAHAFISVNYFSTWSSIVCLIALLVIPSVSFRLPANFTEWVLLISLGTCGFIMQGLLTMGLAYKATGKGGGSGQPKAESYTLANSNTDVLGALNTSKTATHTEDVEMQTYHADVNAVNGVSTSSSSPHMTGSDGVPFAEGGHSQKHALGKKPNAPSSSGTRATSMLYTQMLFALAGDRIVFDITPSFWSWIGIGLVLAGAIWVASARDKPSSTSASDTLSSRAGTANINLDQNAAGILAKNREESLGLLSNSAGGEALESDSEDDETARPVSSTSISRPTL